MINLKPRFCIVNDVLDAESWLAVSTYCEQNGDAFEFIGYGSPVRYREYSHSKNPSIKFKRSFLLSEEEWAGLQNNEISEPFPESTKHGDNYNVYMVDLTNVNHKLYDENIFLILSQLLLNIQQFIYTTYNKQTIFESGPWLTMVPVGGHMSLHCDGTFIADPTKTTDFSAVYYVNDDFEGGELEMPAMGLKIKPKSNSLVIWSDVANEDMAHGVRPVVSGRRFMSQGFFASV